MRSDLAVFRKQFELLPEPVAVFDRWSELIARHDVRGVNAFDTRLVAAAIVGQIETILTFNVKDFRRYSELTALHPSEVISPEN